MRFQGRTQGENFMQTNKNEGSPSTKLPENALKFDALFEEYYDIHHDVGFMWLLTLTALGYAVSDFIYN